MLIAVFQSYGIAVGLETMRGAAGAAVIDPGMFFRASCVVTLVGGTMFLMWLGEQITARGIGNGVSLIIFAGIVANVPHALATLLELGRTGALSPIFILAFLVIAVAVIAFIVFMERAQRRIVVQYPKRQVGNRVMGGDASHMPLKINTSGRHPADLRQFVAADPGDHRRVLRGCRIHRLAGDHRPGAGAWSAAVHGGLCRADHFLQLLLHRRRLQPAGDRGTI